jgi:uncharacterized protein YprB with RNaseH-like and TPR domain
MEKRKELIDYILKNGKTHTWYELALKFNIRPGKNRKERTKAANDVWRNYLRSSGAKSSEKQTSKFNSYVEELLTTKQSYITKPALDVAKGVWKILPEYLQPKSVTELEQQLLITKQIQTDFKQAKVNEISKEQEQLIEIYNEIVDQKEQEKKVLFYDIEVGPNVVYSWRIGNKVNLSTDTIISERQILCISYKWRGDSKVHSLTWNGSDDKELMIKFAAIMNTADEVIGHNSDKYDVKFVRTRCLVHGVPLNVKFNQLDTLKFARAGFAFNSNKLDYISQYLGLGAKIKTDFQLWKDVLNGSKEALDRMVKYCNQDVLVLEKVYETLQPYSPRKKFKLLKSNGS